MTGPSTATQKKAAETAQAALAPAAPTTPAAEDTGGLGEREVKKKKRGATRTVRTSPLGIGGEADVARKSLLGL
jgi:hypothetical protein